MSELNPLEQSGGNLNQMMMNYSGTNIYLGTLIKINGETVLIAEPNDIYELK